MKEHLIPGTDNEMLIPGFWTDGITDGDKLIMNADEIEKFNSRICKRVGTVCNIWDYEEKLNSDSIVEFIEEYKIPNSKMYYLSGKEVTGEFYDELRKNIYIDGIRNTVEVGFGITVRNSSLRSFPTDEGLYKSMEDKEFDRFQETGVQTGEPLAVLHKSRDKNWYFVQMYNYRGWIRIEDVAVARDKNELFEYVNSKDFIVVTGDYIYTQFNPYEAGVSFQRLEMGTRLPLAADDAPENIGNQSVNANYVVRYPVRDCNGRFAVKYGLISKVNDISIGYLAYTRNNILSQVFKLLGHRYGWGDSFNGRDCSSTLMYVYKSFGFMLPRNGSEQEMSEGVFYVFEEGASIEERVALFDKVKPGAGIFMPGHVMMYIGKHDGKPYMIHAFGGYGEKEEGGYKAVTVNEVMVTSTLLTTSSGNLFINKFTSMLLIEDAR